MPTGPTGGTGTTGPTSWDNPGGKYFGEDWVANPSTSGTGYGATGPSFSTGSTGPIVSPSNATVTPLFLAENESYITLSQGTGAAAAYIAPSSTGPAGPTGPVPTGPIGATGGTGVGTGGIV